MRTEKPAARLQARCFLRADLDVPRPNGKLTTPANRPISPRSEGATEAFFELSNRARILQISGREILLFRGEDAPDAVMHELGRCRELTFRAVGQGVGAEVDLTPEDPYYHHLVVWDRDAKQLVGAYRMGKVQEILATRGTGALYLDQIFKIAPDFYAQLGESFELSRSFVMPEYQRDNRALSALWRGLGEAALQHRCHSFYGSVTISNDHHPASRAILVEHLRRHYSDRDDLLRLIEARNPFIASTRYHSTVSEAYSDKRIDSLGPLIADIEGGERSIPPLMRYYCSLGAKYLAFHVEPTFQDALYCLLRIDLEAIDPRYRKRFMGR